jgi:hypothetical protein
MSYVDIEIEIDDYLDKASEEALRLEIKERLKRGRWRGEQLPTEDGVEAWTPLGFAEDLRTAFYARNASRFEALLCALEVRESETA